MIDIQVRGLIGLIVLICDIYAIVKTIQSSATTGAKVLWTVVILVFPLLGLVLCSVAGPKGRRPGLV